jgi:hypothetical protein
MEKTPMKPPYEPLAEREDELEEIYRVVLNYIKAMAKSDLTLMADIFHPNATVTGFFDGSVSVTRFVDGMLPFMKTLPPTTQHSPRFGGRVTSVLQKGLIASAMVEEDQLMDTNFTTFFQLHKVGDAWKITAKVTYAHPKT